MVLKLRLEAPSWDAAKCLGQATDPSNDPWFNNVDEGYYDDTEEARDFCNGVVDGEVCPIRHKCLTFALVNNEKYGVWGGTSEDDRRAMRKMWPSNGTDIPRKEWQWYAPGEVKSLLPPKTRAEIDSDDDA